MVRATERELSAHGAFEPTDEGFAVTTTPFDAAVSVEEANGGVDFRVQVSLPTASENEYWLTGYDVVHGFDQELVGTLQGGGLTVPDLVIRDYPLLIRIAPSRRVFLPLTLRAATGLGG